MSRALILEPHDMLLFRDGKPFSAGTETRARSLFPPTPFTVQGAIRARVLFSSGVSPADYASGATPEARRLQELIGAPRRDYGRLRIRGPFLARKEGESWVRYYPAPADLLVKEGTDREKSSHAVLRPLPTPPWRANFPDDALCPLWLRIPDRLKEIRGWVSEGDLQAYLRGDTPRKVCKEEEFLEREPRFGIALEASRRTVRESYLYLAEFLRLKEGVAFWVEVENLTEQRLGGASGWMQLGGEARAVGYRVTSPALPELLRVPSPLPERFKVVLLTPAWFSGGWQPEGGDWRRFFTGAVRLVSAAVLRYQALGGAYVDDRRRTGDFQKPMRRFVPAGSVYFFEARGEVRLRPGVAALTETPTGEADFGQIGFGLFAVGTWDYA